jgi:hypothetical protein
MTTPQDQTLFEQLAEGVIFLNFKAEVLHSNQAGQAWLPACKAARVELCKLILQVITGKTSLPAAADFLLGPDLEHPAGTRVWLHKHGPHGYALLITSPRASAPERALAARQDVAGHHYVMLMGDQIRQKLADLHSALDADSMPVALRNITWQLDALLHEVGSLALLIQRDQVFSSDRIDLDELLTVGLKRLALGDERAARHALDLESTPRGAVYGDAQWLAYAFEVLLLGLVRGMAPRSHLQVGVRQMGDFVVVTGRNVFGSTRRPAGAAEPGSTQAKASPRSGDPVQLATRMLLAQRILELHSGHLKLTYLPAATPTRHQLAGAIESFAVTLLTGVPQHERSRACCNQCHSSLQAQAYAEDMAQLMASAL